jgi:hypothetical protein
MGKHKTNKGNKMNAISTDVYSTEEVLQSIFTEDTGINLLDSGGTIGRDRKSVV